MKTYSKDDKLDFSSLELPEKEIQFLRDLLKEVKSGHISPLDIKPRRGNIQKIILEHRLIETIPHSIGNLTSLTKLNLNYNHIETIPEELCQCTELKELYLCDNSIKALPECFGELRNLDIINLNHNKLDKLPDSFGNLVKTKYIYLAGNQLSDLSNCYRLGENKFYHTQYIDVSANPIEGLPLEKEHSLCKRLNLSDTPFLNQEYDMANFLIKSKLGSNLWKETLKTLVRKSGIEEFDIVLDAVKNAYRIERHLIRDEDQIGIGESKLGGNPDLPQDVEWPYWKEKPLAFIMQLNLGDFEQFEEELIPSHSGRLYFFYDASVKEDWGTRFPKKKGAWKVIYDNIPPSNLKRTYNPISDRRFTFPSCSIKLHRDISLPSDPHQFLSNYSVLDEVSFSWQYGQFHSLYFYKYLEKYVKLHNLRHLGMPTNWNILQHYLLGYIAPMESSDPWLGWQQLLHLSSDNVLRWNWEGRGGINFIIKKEDLENNRFEEVKAVLT